MRRIGAEHDPATRGRHPHDLHAARVTADLVQGYPRGDLVVAVVKLHAPGEHLVDHGRDGSGIENAADLGIGHAAAGAISHLRVLDVIARPWKQLVISRMVVMHVRNHDMLDPVRGNADGAETVRDRANDLSGRGAAPCPDRIPCRLGPCARC